MNFTPQKSPPILAFTSNTGEHSTACLPLPVPQAAALNRRRGFLGLSFQPGAATGARGGDEAPCPRSAVAKNVMSPLDCWLLQLHEDVILGILMTSQAIFGKPSEAPFDCQNTLPLGSPVTGKMGWGGEDREGRGIHVCLDAKSCLGKGKVGFSEPFGQVTSADNTADSCPEPIRRAGSDFVSAHTPQKPSSELSDSRRLSGEQNGRSRLS